MSSQVEGRYLRVVYYDGTDTDFLCVQCGVEASLSIEVGTERDLDLCPEDAIELALELIQEAKPAMQEEKRREMLR